MDNGDDRQINIRYWMCATCGAKFFRKEEAMGHRCSAGAKILEGTASPEDAKTE